MIQKYLRIHASQEELLDEIFAFEKWPEWWPGMQNTQVEKRGPEQSVIDVEIRSMVTIRMTLEVVRRSEEAISFRQLRGWFKSYTAYWTLSSPEDGFGTVLHISIEFESGMLIPRGMIYASFANNLTQLESALNQRLQVRKPLDRLPEQPAEIQPDHIRGKNPPAEQVALGKSRWKGLLSQPYIPLI